MAKVDTPLNLLVPVHLDALVVNNNSNTLWKDTSLALDNLDNFADYRGLGYILEKKVEDEPDIDEQSEIMPKGIHLHWILPDALRKGKLKKEEGSFIFPPAPNRWLVTRMDARQQLRAWIVESDHINTAANAKLNWIKETTTIQNGIKTTVLQAIAIGNVISFSDWVEPGKGEIELTVIAPGNPDFAASYMSCKNVFGFYDDMKDDDGNDIDDNTHLTYQVYGWYAKGDNTLLQDVTEPSQLAVRLKELGWALKDADMLTAIPGNIIFHSMVQDVLWAPDPVSQLPSASKIDVGIGNTTSEALASLLPAKTIPGQSIIANKLLAAYQFKSLLDKGVEGNGLNLLKNLVHARSFVPVEGGTYFAILPKEKKGANMETDKDNANLPFPAEVSNGLMELNKLQRVFDDKSNELTSLKATLFALKYKKAFGKTIDSGSEDIDRNIWVDIQNKLDKAIDATRERIKTLASGLNALNRRVASDPVKWPETHKGTIVDKFSDLGKLMAANKMTDYYIADLPMPKYFEPADPSVVISGLNPPEKYFKKGVSTLKAYLGETTGNEEDTSLQCRLSNQPANKIKVGDLSTTSASVISDVIGVFIDTLTNKVPAGVPELFYESFLLNILMAAEVSNCMGAQGQGVAEITNVIRNFTMHTSCFSRLDDDKTRPTYLPPVFAATPWKQPWNPLYLEWSATWLASYRQINANILSAWSFGEAHSFVDFAYEPLMFSTGNNEGVYYGRTLLSLQSANKIQELNGKIKKHFGDNLFQNFIPMAQTLSGFTAQLLQRRQGVQLPLLKQVNNSLVMDDDYELIGDQNAWRPMITDKLFYPVRSGKLKINNLRVIDAFGQVIDGLISNANIKTEPGEEAPVFKSSAGLTPVDDRYTFALSPRMIQPARLLFDWKSAGHQDRITDSDPATNPVCGWLLYNTLDNNISVFDTHGKEVALIVEDKTAKKIKYILPPGAYGLLKINNETLNNVVNFIVKSSENFEGIKAQISAVIKKIQAKQSRQEATMSLPTGFPMAVITARFLVEFKEMKAADQSWGGNATGGEFGPIDFTLSIGNAANKADGLIGYFVKNNYADFIVPAGQDSVPAGFSKTAGVKFETESLEHLTLIMDPRTTVSIASGILPVGDYELQQQQVSRALKNISLRILAAPFITPVDKINAPMLQSNNMSWDFINPKIKTVRITDGQGARQAAFSTVYAAEGWLRISAENEPGEEPTT